ncbi:hypothetical protein FRC11_000891, partial [Ceratobasidium sp. 423]
AWDNVLGTYTTAFPPEASRTGTFMPIKSRWAAFKEKLHFNTTNNRVEKPLLFPSDPQLAPTLPKFRQDPPVFRPRVPGTFARDPYDSDSDSDIGGGEKPPQRTPNERKWTASTNYSDATLVNPEGLRRYHKAGRAFQHPAIFTASPSGSHIEYGDKDVERSPELNLGPHRIEPSKDDDANWRPVFLKRSDSINSAKAEVVDAESRDVTTMAPVALYPSDNQYDFRKSDHRSSGAGTPTYALADGSSSTPGLVPATPSLIRALDRVSRAQRQAYTRRPLDDEMDGSVRISSRDRDDAHQNIDNGAPENGDNDRWRGFWNDVQQKAAEP